MPLVQDLRLVLGTDQPLTPVSFAGVGFLALYLAGKMHLWDVYGNRVSQPVGRSPVQSWSRVWMR